MDFLSSGSRSGRPGYFLECDLAYYVVCLMWHILCLISHIVVVFVSLIWHIFQPDLAYL